MKNGMLASRMFDSRVPAEKVTGRERILGYFMGPISVVVMNAILSNYLNVYYTDVLKIGGIWDGMFISVFPIVAKTLDVLTFIYMGLVVDRTSSRQGKARPWILFSAPLMVVCLVMLFVVPTGNDTVTAIWIFTSYTLFYAIAFTMYSTAHTLLVPLATTDETERQRLSTIANTPNMAAGSFVAILFPCLLVPFMGVLRNRWVGMALVLALAAFPMILMEYFFTRERVTETRGEKAEKVTLRAQMKCCLKSQSWIVLMVYFIIVNLINSLFSASTFYYCNWVLGSYNDGVTQAIFYALRQAPLGIGILLCTPLAKRFGKRNSILLGAIISTMGVALCLIDSRNIFIVLAGQFIRAVGLIPSTYMASSLLGDALDDVERVSGQRCDGFSSSVFNCIVTIMGGVAICIFNYGISHLGYQAPTMDTIPVQNDAIQSFIIFCVIGVQLIAYPTVALVTRFMKSGRYKEPKQ